MARERMVTRTVVITTVGVMCLDVTTAEVSIKNYELSGSYTDFETALKDVKKLHETDVFKCVSVQTITEKEVLYGMSEQDFIKLAKQLPPRTKTTDTGTTDNE